MTKGFKVVLLMTVSVAVAMLMAEMFLVIFYPQNLYAFEKGLFKESDEFYYTLAPNGEKTHAQPEYTYTIKSNSYGFRGKEPNHKAAKRILILGDSFGMGQGVKENSHLSALSQDYFKNRGIDLDIFNTSLSGYAGLNQVRILKSFLPDYKPSAVILLFYWNDIGMSRSLYVQNGYLVLNKSPQFSAKLREWLNNNSQLYCLIKKVYYLQKVKKPGARGVGGAYTQNDIDTALEYIKEMKRLCDSIRAEFTVVLLPLEGIYEGSADFRTSKNYLIDQLKKHSIHHKDWVSVLPEEGRSSLIYKVDHHWTDKGHAYFSQYLNQLIAVLI